MHRRSLTSIHDQSGLEDRRRRCFTEDAEDTGKRMHCGDARFDPTIYHRHRHGRPIGNWMVCKFRFNAGQLTVLMYYLMFGHWLWRWHGCLTWWNVVGAYSHIRCWRAPVVNDGSRPVPRKAAAAGYKLASSRVIHQTDHPAGKTT